MSYTNVYPSRINWENEPSIASPINATNLNKMDYALYQHDQTLGTWDTTKANQSDLLLSVKEINYDDETGVFVFTWQNGTTKTVDLNIEKIPVSFSMDANGVITMTTDDGTTYTADVGALIKTYTFTDSSEIDFTVTTDSSGNKTVTASIVAGSITGSKLEPNYLANCQNAANSASGSATAADGSAEDAEAWAVGTRDGVPVPNTDPAYNNNSKYWATQGGANSLAGLSDTDINSPTDGQGLVYNYSTSKWINGNVSSGSTITVFTNESSLYGRTVTLTIGQQTKTETFSNVGVVVFKGIVSTGTFTITSSTSGGDTATATLDVPYFGNYTKQLTLFSATVTITFPYSNGATCKLSDGVTELVANTSPMAFNVPNVGTWTATCTIDNVSAPTQSAVITTDGQTETMTFTFGTINLTYDNAFRGLTITCVNGGTTISKTAPISGNTMAFYPPSTGEWVISSTYSGVPYQTSATITSLATPVSASLQQVPNGKTVTPTDDIQKWLNCAGIFDKTSYTTLADVLADSTTLLALMSSNNASDYLVRSTSFSTALGLVPQMTGETTPSGQVIKSGQASATYAAYMVFDRTDNYWGAGTMTDGYVGYVFPNPVVVRSFKIDVCGNGVDSNTAPSLKNFKIQKSADGNTWTDVYTGLVPENYTDQHIYVTGTITDTTPVRYYRLFCIDRYYSNGLWIWVRELQFYLTSTVSTENQGLCDNATAMTDIGANNYCANILLDDATWCTAICNSTYFESVLNVKVPTMTSNNTPSGECFGEGIDTNYYSVFDGNGSSYMSMTRASTSNNVGYDFTKNVCVKKVGILISSNNDNSVFSIEGSSDQSTWTPIDDVYAKTTWTVYNIDNNDGYRYHRARVKTGAGSYNQMQIYTVQFYGR